LFWESCTDEGNGHPLHADIKKASSQK